MNKKNISKDLLEFGLHVNKSTDLNFVLEKIIEEKSLSLLSTKRAVLYLLDDKKEFLIPKSSILKKYIKQTMKEPIPIESSLSGKVVKAKIGMIFNSTSEIQDAYQIPGTSDAKDENLMVLPLIINNEVFGTINFYRDNVPYTEQELDLAKVYSMYASIAIQNAHTNNQLLKEINDRKESEEKFRNFFNDNLAGAYLSTPNGQLIDCNQAFVDLAGYPDKETALSTNAKNLYEKSADRNTKIDRLRKHKKINQYEEELIRFDGKKIYVVSNVWGEYDKNGELKTIQGYTRDITKIKEADEELRRSERKFSTFFNNDLVATYISTPNGELIDCNQAYIDMMRYPDKETALSKTTYSIYPENVDRDEKIKKLKNLQSLDQHEEELVRYDGEIFTAASSMWGVYDGDELLYIQGLTQDISDRKIAEENLIIGNQRYQKSQEIAKVGNWEYNIQTARFWGSDEAKHIYGFDPKAKDFTAEEVESCIPDRESVHQALVDLIEKGKPYDLEFDIITKDKKILKTITSVAQLEKDEDGKPLKVTGAIQDVTERKIAENKLLESYKMIEGIISSIPARVFWKDKDLNYLGCNTLFAQDAGFSDPNDIIGKDDFQMNWKDRAELYRGDDLEVINSGKAKINIEEMQTTPDGKTIDLITNKIPLTNSENEIIGVLGTYIDITDKKKTEKDLKESEQKYKNVIEHSNQMFYVHDIHNILSFVSPQSEQVLGYKPDELLVNWTAIATNNPFNEKAYELTQKAIQTGKRQPDYLLELKRKDGRIIIVKVNESPLKDKDGKVIGITGSLEDVTKQLRAEEELKESEEKFRSIVEGSIQGLVIAQDNPTRLSYASRPMEDITGFNMDELMNFGQKELVELIHPDDRQRFFESFKKRLSGEKFSPNAEYRIVHKNGKIRWVDLYSSLITVNNEPATQTVFIDITDKKEAEEELRRSEEQFRSVLDNIELIGLMLDEDANIIYVNDYLLKLTGHKRSDVTGKNWFDIFVEIEGTKADVMNVFRKTAKENNLVTKYENPILTKSGGQKLIRWSNTSYKSRDGNIILTSIGEDITDFKKHELEILEKNEKLELFATIFENLNECITVTDKDHKIFYVNSAFKKLYGYTEDEYIGKTADFLRTDNDTEYLKKIKQATHNGGWSGEIDNRKKDGTVFPIELSTTRIYDKEKNIIARIGIVRDITEKKKIGEELNAEREKYTALVENSTDAIYMVDIDGVVTFVNSFGAKMLGREVKSVIGKSINKLFPEKVAEIQKDFIKKVFETGEIVRTDSKIEFPVGKIWLENILIPVFNDEGKVTNTIGVSRDISEKKKYELELEEHRSNLEKLVSERTEELEEKNKMLDSSVKVFVGREQTIIKLKNKIKELEAQLEAAK